jgi:hypothetical protein
MLYLLSGPLGAGLILMMFMIGLAMAVLSALGYELFDLKSDEQRKKRAPVMHKIPYRFAPAVASMHDPKHGKHKLIYLSCILKNKEKLVLYLPEEEEWATATWFDATRSRNWKTDKSKDIILTDDVFYSKAYRIDQVMIAVIEL